MYFDNLMLSSSRCLSVLFYEFILVIFRSLVDTVYAMKDQMKAFQEVSEWF